MPPSRRSVLAGVATALAGCAGSPANPTDDPTLSPAPVETGTRTPTEQTDEPTTAEHYRALEFQVYERDVTAVGEGVLRGEEYLEPFEADIIDRATSEGSTTFTTYTYAPLRERTYVQRGDYYRLDRTVEDERELTVHRFNLDAVSDCGDSKPTASKAVAFDDLPAADRRAFVHSHEEELSEEVCFGSSYRYHYETEAAVESSRLVNDSPTYVGYEGELYVVEFQRTQTTHERAYRFDATRLGSTPEEYAELIAPDVVWTVDPDTLSGAELGFVETLVHDGHYRTENPIPPHVDSVADTIRQEAYSVEEFGPYYLRYRDTYYAASVEEVMS